MATKHDTPVPFAALAAILVALAIGSAPAAVLVALSSHLEALK